MKVLDKAIELKNKGTTDLWIKKENDYEYCYGLYGYSSIENEDYVEMNKRVFLSEVKDVEIISNKTTRITY